MLSNFTKIIYMLFLIGTVIALFIVYKNVENGIAIRFLFVYMFFGFFVVIYILFINILKYMKHK